MSIRKQLTNIVCFLTTLNIQSPLWMLSDIYHSVDPFVRYLHTAPYSWHRKADGTIVGMLNRGFDRFYGLEWRTDNSIMAKESNADGLTSACMTVGFESRDDLALILKRVFEALV